MERIEWRINTRWWTTTTRRSWPVCAVECQVCRQLLTVSFSITINITIKWSCFIACDYHIISHRAGPFYERRRHSFCPVLILSRARGCVFFTGSNSRLPPGWMMMRFEILSVHLVPIQKLCLENPELWLWEHWLWFVQSRGEDHLGFGDYDDYDQGIGKEGYSLRCFADIFWREN